MRQIRTLTSAIPPSTLRPLALGLSVVGLFASTIAQAVRVNADGHGQALIYPYYTARSTPGANAYVTAVSVTNVSSKPKALKVRFLEGKAGAQVFDFNLFLAAYDVWTAGIVGAGTGAGLFTQDNSCTLPKISNSSITPTKFGNAAYVGDLLGDSLDRTYEGYFEVLEMGVIDPLSALGVSVTHSQDLSSPNASKPPCSNLPLTNVVPVGLSRPSGGLVGNASYINLNEGTDYSVDAIALSQWSDKVQWSAAGNARPNLADASPFASYVVNTQDAGDIAYLSKWNSGRDAVTALFMVNSVRNDFSVEPAIKAATDWLLTLPTKRFYVSAAKIEPPFGGGKAGSLSSPSYICELRAPNCGVDGYYDRESQSPGCPIDFAAGIVAIEPKLCGAASMLTFTPNAGSATVSHVFGSTTARTFR